jgi:hypothetical protein
MDSILHTFRMLWYGVEGAILVSETTDKTDLVLRRWACSTVLQGIRAVASGALPNRGFSQAGDKRAVDFRFTKILIVCTVRYMPVGGLCDIGCVRRGKSAGRSA